MKKLLLSLLAILNITILTGCSGDFAANGNSYLDQKIKCRNLAEEKLKKVKDDLVKDIDFKNANLESVSKYAPKEDACFLKNQISTNSNTYNSIENLLTGEKISYDEKSFAVLNCEVDSSDECKNILPEKIKYDELIEKYFGEDADQVVK